VSKTGRARQARKQFAAPIDLLLLRHRLLAVLRDAAFSSSSTHTMSQPSSPSLTAYQRQLLFFGDAHRRVTIPSALRGALRLGLNFPLALALSLTLRALYASNPLRPINILKLPARLHRSQLEHAALTEPAYTRPALLALVPRAGLAGLFDRAHVLSFWALAARREDLRVDAADVRRFQDGGWADAVAQRRRGRQDVLPFWRGGPLWPGGHSFVVRHLFGVRVYERQPE
jgi:hypothetical protein